MDFLNEVINYVENYYWASLLPSKLHPSHMSRFLTRNQYGDGNVVGFTKNIYQTILRLTYDESPYTDGHKFYYPVKYFYNEFFEKRGLSTRDNVKLAIALFNGISVHEAAHCRIIENWHKETRTNSNNEEKSHKFNLFYLDCMYKHLGMKPLDDNNPDDRKKLGLMMLCSNLVEDLFIEKHYIAKFYVWANRFLKYATGLFFDKFSFDNKENKEITCYDVYYLRSNDNDFIDELLQHELIKNSYDVLDKLKFNSTVMERGVIAAELYKLFQQDVDKNPDNYANGFEDMLNALLQEIGEFLQKIANGEISKEDLKNLMNAMGGNSDGNGEEKEVKGYAEHNGKDVKETNEELENTEKFLHKEFLKQSAHEAWNKNVIAKDILDKYFTDKRSLSYGVDANSKIQFLPKLKSLANTFRYAKHGKVRTLRHLETGLLDEQNLHDISLGNIFRGIKQEKRAKNRPQIVTMVDLSGSTNSLNGMKIPLFYQELNLSYSMTKLLTATGIPNSSYSHTTHYSSGEGHSSEIAGLSSYEMPFLDNKNKYNTNNLEERYNKMLQKAGLQGNADGYALRYAAERFDFTKKQTKILIMINDGLPAESTWGGYNPTSELIASIEQTRKKGIVVLVFASTEDVVDNLIPLYGEDYVIRAYGDNADKEASKILDVLITAF